MSKIFSNGKTKIILIIFWILIFLIIVTQFNFFSYKNIPVTGANLFYYKIREFQKPKYSMSTMGYVMQGSNNSLLFNELRPNSDVLFDGLHTRFDRITHIKINSQGFRGKEYVYNKKQDVFRIIVLGDSFTFGIGVELNETYPYLLEKKLQESFGKSKFEVFNFGVPGYALSNEAEQIKIKALNFQPNLIIIGITLANEFKENNAANTLIDCIKKRDACLSRIENPLKKIYEITKQNKIPVLIVILNDVDYFMKEKILNISNIYEFYYMNMEKMYRDKKIRTQDLFVFYPFDSHFSASANEIVANEIFDYLRENQII